MKTTKPERFNPNREYVTRAIDNFLKSGGRIHQLPRDERRDALMVGLTTEGASAYESNTLFNR